MMRASMARLALALVCFQAILLVVTAFSTPSALHSALPGVRTCGTGAGPRGLPLSLNRRIELASTTALRLGGDGTVKKEQDEDEDEEEDEDEVPFEIRMDALRRMQSFKASQSGQKDLQSGRIQYNEIPLEVDVLEAAKKLRLSRREEEDKDKVFLLDVREQDEYEFCRLDDSVLIPLSDMKARFDEVPKDREVLVYCHHGMRSMQVVRYLRTRGWRRVTNIQGGIEEWRQRVDPTIPPY